MRMLKKISSGFRQLYFFCDSILLLMSRDIKSRFNGNVLNYLMVLAVPLAWIGITVVSFKFLSRTVPIFTDDISFVMAGILPYLLFRYTITATMRTQSSYNSVYFIYSIKRWYVTFALSLIELINAVVIYIVVSVTNYFVFYHWEVYKPMLIFQGMLLAWLLGFSFGYLCDALSEKFPLIFKMVPVFLRPMFLISAVFYTANELPYSIFQYLNWNPLLHANETVREGMFGGYHSFYAAQLYPLAFTFFLFLIGVIFRAYCCENTN